MSKEFTEQPHIVDATETEFNYSDGIISGAAIADEMFKDVPACLRVRLAVDTLANVVTLAEIETIETLLKEYLDEASVIEADFDWDSI